MSMRQLTHIYLLLFPPLCRSFRSGRFHQKMTNITRASRLSRLLPSKITARRN